MQPRLPTLVLLTLAATLALGAPAQALVPIPNGDFTLGDAGWAVTGMATIADGVAKLGQDGCFGPEENGEDVARIQALAPFAYSSYVTKLRYDYKIRTSDSEKFDGIAVYLYPAVAFQGLPVLLEKFNPSPGWGTCGTFTGSRVINLPLQTPQRYPARVTFQVYGDGFGDLFYAEIDNVQLTV